MRLSLIAAALVAASAFGPNVLALDEICTAADTCLTSTGRTCDRSTGSCPPCVSIPAFSTFTCVNRSSGRCPAGTSDCTATTTPSPTTSTPTPTVTTKAPTTAPPTSAPPTTEPPTEAPTTEPPVESASASASASGSSAGTATEAPTTTKPATTKAPKTTKPPTAAPETEAPTTNVTETVEPQKNATLPASDVQNNSSKESSGLKLPVILGIVAGGVVVIAALAFLIWKRNRDDEDDDYDDDDFRFNKPAYTARAAGAGGAAAGAGAGAASAYGSNPSNLSKTTYNYSSNAPAPAPTSPGGAMPGLAGYPASRFGANRYGRYGSAKYSGSTDYGVPSTMFLAPGGQADAARGSLSGSNSSSEERDVWGNSTHTNSATNSKKAASPATPLGGTRAARSDSYEF